MSTKGSELLEAALNLPPEERAQMAERLLTSLEVPSDERIDELWAEEAEDRLDAYERGEIKTIRASEAFGVARSPKPR
jgi:putative addiction module component (TIGR02574 family)